MGRRWKEVSDGKVQLRVYPGGVAGDESDMVRKMGIGQLQAATITNIGLGSIDRATVALQVPMMFRSYAELDYVRGKLAPELEKRLADKGFVVLDWGDAGWVHFFAKEKVVEPEDLGELKMYVWSGDPQSERAWRAAGFDVVPTASSDVLQGLQTGRLEAFATVPLYALASQWFALAPHMLAVKWSPLAGATVVKKDVWEKIDPALREKLKKIAAEETEASRAEIRKMGQKAIAAMKDRNLEVVDPGPEVVAKWRAAARKAYPVIEGKVVPEAMFDRVQKLLEDYRAKKGG
jgi:TRAP-type C4-dicarboxylate transport system substrate-binding protein